MRVTVRVHMNVSEWLPRIKQCNDKSPSVWFLFCDVILDLSKYKHHELVFNSCYKHAMRCVMTMMVIDSYLHKKHFLALHNACVQFSGVTTVVISQFII